MSLKVNWSALKHGVAGGDIAHAVRHAIGIKDQEDDLRLYLTMREKKTYGKTASGVPITDELIERLAAKAEAGFDVDEILERRRGRPPMGSGPAKVESVRLDPELREALAERAESDHEATSSVIRKALRQYLTLG